MREESVINSATPSLPLENKSQNMPVFSKVIITTDLLFCALYIFYIPAYIINMIMERSISSDDMLFLITGVIISSSGLCGDIMLLKNKSYGMKLAYVNFLTSLYNAVIIACTIILNLESSLRPATANVINYPALWLLIPVSAIIFQCIFLVLYWKAISKVKVFLTEYVPLPEKSCRKADGLSGFVVGFMITDIILCSFYMISSIAMICFDMHPVVLASALLILMSGIAGNLLILRKKPSGIKLAYVNIISTLCSMIILVYCWIGVLYRNGTSENPNYELFTAFTVLLFLTMIIRCVYLFFYWKAVSKAKAFFMERATLEG